MLVTRRQERTGPKGQKTMGRGGNLGREGFAMLAGMAGLDEQPKTQTRKVSDGVMSTRLYLVHSKESQANSSETHKPTT